MIELVIPNSKKAPKKKNQLFFFNFLQHQFSRNKFSTKNKKVLFNDLSILLSSGIDLLGSLNLVLNNFKREKDKQLIKSIIHHLTEGNSLNVALRESNTFSIYEYFSVKIGEETGTLVEILKELGKFESERLEQRKKIISAVSYPLMVLFTAMIAVVFMLKFIVPMFQEVFTRFDKELPKLTQTIIQLSDKFGYYCLVVFTLLFLLLLVNAKLSTNSKYLRFKSNLIIHLPFIGPLIKKIVLVRFILAMELLLSAKTPIVECIKLTRDMIKFQILKDALFQIEKDLLDGISLNKSMSAFEIFDGRMVALIKVAEEVNKLEDIFREIRNQVNNEIEYQMGLISNILEPVLIIFIGLFVGLILVSMYLPIFQISNSFF